MIAPYVTCGAVVAGLQEEVFAVVYHWVAREIHMTANVEPVVTILVDDLLAACIQNVDAGSSDRGL